MTLPTDDRDDFDLLSAIWILTCNDPNPMITFRGILHRLDLPDERRVRDLVYRRGELFRRRMPDRRLEEWKVALREDPERRPSWIRALPDEARQIAAIDALTPDDGFRSQFRAGRDAKPSGLDVVDWGLQHIERLRKGRLEAREETIRRWQLWSVIILTSLNIVVTVAVALLK